MKVICQNCSRKIDIPDAKIPKGKAFSITCPKCKEKISIKPNSAEPAKKPKPPAKAPVKKTSSVKEESSAKAGEASLDNPFEFLEDGAKTAVICEEDDRLRASINEVLKKLNYHILESLSPRDALKQMRYHIFDLVVINETFGTRDPDMNHVLKYISQLAMITRRNMFVALVSDRFRTGDNMQAFHKSVNAIINLQDMNKFESLIQHYIKENDSFYKTFKDIFTKLKGI